MGWKVTIQNARGERAELLAAWGGKGKAKLFAVQSARRQTGDQTWRVVGVRSEVDSAGAFRRRYRA